MESWGQICQWMCRTSGILETYFIFVFLVFGNPSEKETVKMKTTEKLQTEN